MVEASKEALDLLGTKGAVDGTSLDLSERIANIPTGSSKEAKAERNKLWGKIDDGNGYLSYSEFTANIFNVLGLPIILSL